MLLLQQCIRCRDVFLEKKKKKKKKGGRESRKDATPINRVKPVEKEKPTDGPLSYRFGKDVRSCCRRCFVQRLQTASDCVD